MTTSDGHQHGTGEPPSDPDELRREIGELRADLGDTVEALARKADVKAQASQKATEVKARVKDKAVEVKSHVQGRAGDVRSQVQDRAGAVTGSVRQKVGDGRRAAGEAGGRVPDAVRRPGPIPLAAVGGAVALAVVLLVWRRRRGGR